MKDIGSLAAQRNEAASKSAYIRLLYIEADSTTTPGAKEAFRFASTTEDVEFGTDSLGNPIVWQAFPFSIGVITEDGEGSLPRIQITVANVQNVVLQALLERKWLDDERVEILLTNRQTLEDPSAALRWEGRVNGVAVDEQAVTISVGNEDLYGVVLPGTVMTPDGCNHVYGGDLCQFPIEELDPDQATLGPCSKTLPACRLRGTHAVSQGWTGPVLWPRQFGAFPGILQS